MPETSRPITPDEFLLEALVRGGDVLTIAQRRFGWSVTQVLDWFDQPWVQMHLAGARELEDVRYDFTLARVRGKVTQRLAELSMAEGIAPETQRKAAEEVTRTIRARDRRARASAAPSTPAPAATTTQPAPRQEHAAVKAASPPSPPPAAEVSEATVTPEGAVAPEVAAARDTPEPVKTPAPTASPVVAPVAAEQTSVSVDDARGQEEAPASPSGEPQTDKNVCPTGEDPTGKRERVTDRHVGTTVADTDGDRVGVARPGVHGRGRASGREKIRTAAIDGPAFVGGADARRGVTRGGCRGLRAGPGQKSRPPPAQVPAR